MPNFPRYQSKGSLTTQQPSAFAPTDTTGEVVAKAGQQIGKDIQESSLKWSNAVDTIQKTTSAANRKIGLLDINTRAANDPNYNNADQYIKEAEKLIAETSKGFSSKTAETENAIEAAYDFKVTQVQIQNTYKKKMIDVGQTSTFKLLDMEANKPGADMESRMSGILNQQVAAGVFDHKDAYTIQKEYLKKGKFNTFLSDIQSNPSVADSNLSSNKYDFDVKELRDARAIFDDESKKIKVVNQKNILDAYLSGEEVGAEDVKSLLKEGKIEPEFAEGMINKINNPQVDRPSQDKAYIEFQNKVMDMQAKGDKATTDEISKLMADTIKAHSKGLLDKADVERILKDRNELIQKKLEKTSEDILSQTHPKTILQKLSFWSDEYAKDKPDIKARMYRKLIDGIMAGSDPYAVAAKVVDDEIEFQLGESLKYPNRKYALDPKTKKRIAYSDDGEITWTNIETGKEMK